ncbi:MULTISPECIES: hypothetical protein [unclassified Variovorax]
MLVHHDFEFRVLDTEGHRIRTIAIVRMPRRAVGDANS